MLFKIYLLQKFLFSERWSVKAGIFVFFVHWSKHLEECQAHERYSVNIW